MHKRASPHWTGKRGEAVRRQSTNVQAPCPPHCFFSKRPIYGGQDHLATGEGRRRTPNPVSGEETAALASPEATLPPGGTRWWCHFRGGCFGHLLLDTVWELHLGHTSYNIWTAQQQRLNQPPRSTVSRLRNSDFQSSCNTRIPAVPFPTSAVLGVAASTAAQLYCAELLSASRFTRATDCRGN